MTSEANESIVKTSDAIPRKDVDLKIGVAQSLDLGETVNIRAQGYDRADCTGPWSDDSNMVTRTFIRGRVIDDVLLVLDGRPIVNSDGGVELCGNTADDDGDGLVDCADTECDGKSCGVPNACVGGQCVATSTEVDCGNDVDDDNNGLKDCADPACATRLCTSGDACLTNKRCAGMQCSGDAVVCPAAGECQTGAGTCQPDGGACTYTERTGPCGDGGTCTAGRCTLSFPFTPTNIPQDLTEAQVGGALRLDCGESRFDTDTATWTNLCASQVAPPTFMVNQPSGAPVLRVMGVRSLDVLDAGRLVITGSMPLAIAVLGDATVGGHLEANADGGTNGAGSPGNGCGTSAGANGVVGTQSGGGGAGHGEAGGRGGHASGTNNTGGSAGLATTDTDLSPLRGGCPGGFGGIPSGTAAAGGGGGGAFQLTVAGTLRVNGRLVANGAGGQGGPATRGGGGGGGSGGGILLEASSTVLTATARVLALGGGGGGGADNASPGDPGQDGALDRGGANGGAKGGGNGGNGGDGADWDSTAENGGDSGNGNGAGGGGGGALGRIVIRGSCAQDPNTDSAPVISLSICAQD